MVERIHHWEFADLANLLIMQNIKSNEVPFGLNKEQSGCTAPLGTRGKHTGINNMAFNLLRFMAVILIVEPTSKDKLVG